MVKPSIKYFHNYIKNGLPKEILKRYESFYIISEADLQSYVWQQISEYFRRTESRAGIHKVFNKPYLKELNIHPDLVVFRRNKPWVIIELKEGKRLKNRTAEKEFERIIKTKDHFKSRYGHKVKRGYLLYVSRYGDKRVLKGPKGKGARFFFEIPISLENYRTTKYIKNWEKDFFINWEKDFKKWSKYVSRP